MVSMNIYFSDLSFDLVGLVPKRNVNEDVGRASNGHSRSSDHFPSLGASDRGNFICTVPNLEVGERICFFNTAFLADSCSINIAGT